MVRDVKSSILGQRVANIYDLSDKIYLFKFAVPGVSKKVCCFSTFDNYV